MMAYLLLGVKFFFLSDSGNVPLLPILKIGNKVLIFVESLS